MMCFKASPHIPLVKGSHMAKPASRGHEVHTPPTRRAPRRSPEKTDPVERGSTVPGNWKHWSVICKASSTSKITNFNSWVRNGNNSFRCRNILPGDKRLVQRWPSPRMGWTPAWISSLHMHIKVLYLNSFNYWYFWSKFSPFQNFLFDILKNT